MNTNPKLSTLDLLLRSDFARADPQRVRDIYRNAAPPTGKNAGAAAPSRSVPTVPRQEQDR